LPGSAEAEGTVQLAPPSTSTPTAAVMASGTLARPSRLARRTSGRPPAVLAARSHRIHASEPVTNRLGPTLRPMRSA